MEGVPKPGGESAHPQGEAVDRKALTLPDSSSYVESAWCSIGAFKSQLTESYINLF